MKLTKTKLKQLIKEELDQLAEQEDPSQMVLSAAALLANNAEGPMPEGQPGQGMYLVNAHDMQDLRNALNSLEKATPLPAYGLE